jgi:hypothetical protein
MPKSKKPAKAPAKNIVKSAPKKVAKKVAKVVAKPVSKVAVKKPAVKAPVKEAKKPLKKPIAAKEAEKVVAKVEAKPLLKKPLETEPKVVKAAPVAKVKATKVTPVKEEVIAVVEEPQEEAEIILTDAEGRRYCRVKECDQVAMVEGYCRYHYLLFWKRIQVRKKILSEGKLERYVEELTSRYPDKYLEMIRKDLKSEKDFVGAIQELEIDESSVDNEYEDEAQNFIEEVRGMSTETGGARDDDEF